MEPRRIAALALIERLKRQEIAREAEALGRLRAEAAALDSRRDALEGEVRAGSIGNDPGIYGYLAGYLPTARTEIARLTRERARLDPELVALEDRVSDAFREMKTVESVRLKAEADATRARRRRADAAHDETALTRWWRDRRR